MSISFVPSLQLLTLKGLILPRILLQPHNPIQDHIPLRTLPIHAEIRNPHPLEPYRLRPRLLFTAILLPIFFPFLPLQPLLPLSPTSLTRPKILLTRLSRPRRAPPNLLEAGL